MVSDCVFYIVNHDCILIQALFTLPMPTLCLE